MFNYVLLFSICFTTLLQGEKKYTEKEISLLVEVDSFREDYSTKEQAVKLLNAIQILKAEIEDDLFDDIPGFVEIVRALEDSTPGSEAEKYIQKHGGGLLEDLFNKTFEQRNIDNYGDNILSIVYCELIYNFTSSYNHFIKLSQNKEIYSSYVWSHIFQILLKNHPLKKQFLEDILKGQFSEELLYGITVSGNNLLLKKIIQSHPLDNDIGKRLFKKWLSKEANVHYAYYSAVACAFLKKIDTKELLNRAMTHDDFDVKLEGAWAAVKKGNTEGIKVLQDLCLMVNYSRTAWRYMAELKIDHLVPEAAKEGSFAMKAEFASWLAHPNELGEYPDELIIEDTRELLWPMEEEKKTFRIISYKLKDKTGLSADDTNAAVMGSTTFCAFGYNLHIRPPEDAYAIHCMWELDDYCKELPVNHDTQKLLKVGDSETYRKLKVLKIIKMDPELNLKVNVFGIAQAEKNGHPGFLVMETTKNFWYPKDEQPKYSPEFLVLKMHIGRRLLGFEINESKRKEYLSKLPIEPSPENFVKVFEEKLTLLKKNNPTVEEYALLGKHFEKYCEHKSKITKIKYSKIFISTFEKLYLMLKNAPDKIKEEHFDNYGAVGRNLISYLELLVAAGRSDEIKELMKFFEPYFDHNLGYGLFGNAAFMAKDFELSEYYLTKLHNDPNCYNNDKIFILAKIWKNKGLKQKSQKIYLDKIKLDYKEILEATYESDRDLFIKVYKESLKAYQKEFPEESKKYKDPLPELQLKPLEK